MKKQQLALTIAISLFSGATLAEFSATWQQELAVQRGGDIQKFEGIFQPEWSTSITDNLDMNMITRVRGDSANRLGYQGDRLDTDSSINGALADSRHADIEIREWYFDTQIADTFWRIGKQQVVWGQADGLKVLDVINPQSYREFTLDDFDDSRIPLWMFNVEVPINDDDSLQVLWVPDQTYHRFAIDGSDYQMTSSLMVPQQVAGITLAGFNENKPNDVIADSDLGLRYSKFYQGWDLTFNYLYHYIDTPVLYQKVTGNQVTIDANYKRNNLYGFTASKAFDSWTLRTEAGYNTASYHLLDNNTLAFLNQDGIGKSADLSSVIGLDWQGLSDIMLSVQWFQSSLLDYDAAMIRPEHDQMWSFLYTQNFANETWVLEVLTIYGVDKKDTSMQLDLSYMLESNIKLWTSMDVFAGNRNGLFGQFSDTDRVSFGFEWGF